MNVEKQEQQSGNFQEILVLGVTNHFPEEHA